MKTHYIFLLHFNASITRCLLAAIDVFSISIERVAHYNQHSC